MVLAGAPVEGSAGTFPCNAGAQYCMELGRVGGLLGFVSLSKARRPG